MARKRRSARSPTRKEYSAYLAMCAPKPVKQLEFVPLGTTPATSRMAHLTQQPENPASSLALAPRTSPKHIATAGCIWLDVPYERKDEAKRLGARWDAAKRKWFVSQYTPIGPFLRAKLLRKA